MTTMYKTISAERTAEGATLDFFTLFDLFSNDWSVISSTLDLGLDEGSVPSSTSGGGWVTIREFEIIMPTYSIDAEFDDIEAVLTIRVESFAVGADYQLRMTDGTNTSNVTEQNDTSYATQPVMTLVLDSIPTGGSKTITIECDWQSDPGETAFVKRSLSEFRGDCELFLRVKP